MMMLRVFSSVIVSISYPLMKSSWSFFFLQILGDFLSEPAEDPEDPPEVAPPEVVVALPLPPEEVCFRLPARLRELFIMASRSRSILRW